MITQIDEVLERVNALIDEYRTTCLWSMRKDAYPVDAADAIRYLRSIQNQGDLRAYKRAGELIECLSLQHNNPSAR